MAAFFYQIKEILSRKPKQGQWGYSEIDEDLMDEYPILINCTPLGTYPNIEEKPLIPYQFIRPTHLLYDLIYNPEETAFLKEGKRRGATISSGLKMLELQAEKAWQIWKS